MWSLGCCSGRQAGKSEQRQGASQTAVAGRSQLTLPLSAVDCERANDEA